MNAMIRRGAGLATVLAGFGIVAAGCLTRPVTTTPPQTTSNFTAVVQNQVVDKIDLLFDIDNSASMGDKQGYLIKAIPDLINQLLNPGCVDANGNPITNADGAPVLSTGGTCPAGMGQPAFAPVHDMHLGIVTSSLGQRLSELNAGPSDDIICQTNLPAAGAAVGVQYPTGIAAHNDDQGHLVAREITYSADLTTATEGPAPDSNVPLYDTTANTATDTVANWGGFLDWFPTTGNTGVTNNALPAGLNPVTAGATLESDFATMVQGVGIYGCGIESQLESWYRFLIQPDPYLTLTSNNGAAVWSGVDTTILQERHDFLRPDSLVAVVVLSDENDSEIDVRSYGGQGYLFMGGDISLGKGTSACLTNPASGSCVNCGSNPSDPNCTTNADYPPSAGNDWGQNPNLRHVHMKAKYGVDPQYPWQRYVIGLTSPTVPDRNGEYPPGQGNYNLGNNNCTNPLFAAALPDPSQLANLGTVTAGVSNPALCNLPLGTARTPAPGAATSSLVFYAIIGGVPHQLLHFDPTDAGKSELSPQDWVRILGRGPASLTISQIESVTPNAYDYTGIDPHMIEGYLDRTLATIPAGQTNAGQPNPFSIQSIAYDASQTTCNGQATCANALVPATSTAVDPVNGREWTTELPYNTTPPTGTGAATATVPYAPHVLPVDRQYACTFPIPPRDCTQAVNNYECDCPDGPGLTADEVPPLCNPATPTSQIFAKAYPTPRELQVARLMGTQGIVSSLCPIDVNDTTAAGDDPLYGYRPAVTTIINRLKNALTNQCLPEQLPTTTSDSGTGQVPCLILVQMPAGGSDGGAGGSCLDPVCPASEGLSIPESDVLQKFCANQELAFTSGGSKGTDPANLSVCQLTQLTNPADFENGSCATSNELGWCYVVGAKGCAQSIVFPTNSPPPGATAFLQCIEQTVSVLDGG